MPVRRSSSRPRSRDSDSWTVVNPCSMASPTTPLGIGSGAFAKPAVELLRVGDRQAAGEVLADVRGGPAVDRLASAQQRPLRAPPVAGAARPARRAGGSAARRTVAPSVVERLARPARPPRVGAKWKCIACSRCANACGWRAAGLVEQPEDADAPAPRSRARRSARRGAAARRPPAELPDGIGWSLEVLAARRSASSWSRGGREEAAARRGRRSARSSSSASSRARARTSAARTSPRRGRAAPRAGRRGPRGRR